MKFGKLIRSHEVESWRYINYKMLKQVIKEKDAAGADVRAVHAKFRKELLDEIAAVSAFFTKAQSQHKAAGPVASSEGNTRENLLPFDNPSPSTAPSAAASRDVSPTGAAKAASGGFPPSQLEEAAASRPKGPSSDSAIGTNASAAGEAQGGGTPDIKGAHLTWTVHMLRQFAVLNYLAVLKICKKHDKNFPGLEIRDEMRDYLQHQPFYKALTQSFLLYEVDREAGRHLPAAFVCPVCYDQVGTPLDLQCGHSLCWSCAMQAAGQDTQACPVCQKEERIDPVSLSIETLLGSMESAAPYLLRPEQGEFDGLLMGMEGHGTTNAHGGSAGLPQPPSTSFTAFPGQFPEHSMMPELPMLSGGHMGGTTLPEIGLPGGGTMSTPGLPVGLPPPALGQATNAINFSVGNPLPAATASSSPGVLGVANAFGGTEAMKLAPGAAQVQQKTQQERNPAPNIIPQARGTATSIAPPRNPSAEANGGAANPTPSVDDTNSQSNTKPTLKRKRQEPTPGMFETHTEYLEAWSKWRVTRDSNNAQVKRSREKARQRAREAEALKSNQQKEVQLLQQQVSELLAASRRQDEVLRTTQMNLRLALRSCFAPSALTLQERSMIQSIVRGIAAGPYPPTQ